MGFVDEKLKLNPGVLFFQITPKIKAKLMEKGVAMISYQPLEEKPNFFRCVFSNLATQRQDVDFLLDEIACLGAEL